jgi:hypothetical protein
VKPTRILSRLTLVTVAASVAILLAACGSGGAPSSGAPSSGSSSGGSTASGTKNTFVPAPSDSCTVVTHSDVSTALGETVNEPVKGKATVEGGVACVFYGQSVTGTPDPDVPSPDSVRVVLVTGADGPKWFNDYKSKVAAVPISGLGDQAYYDGKASVSVLKGSSYLRISVITTSGTDESAEKTLAATAVPRM